MNPQKEKRNHMNNTQTLANERIRAPQVRLIMPDGTNLGVISTRDALTEARRMGLDLVAINPQAQPMVVKILDLNKYLYEEKRAAKERARKSRESEIQIKEVQLRPVTDAHDIGIKAKNAQNWLLMGHKVKVVIKFRGREMAFRELGMRVLDQFLTAVGDHKLEREPQHQGNQILVLLQSNVKSSD
jgi:translation initiation factor IF-3